MRLDEAKQILENNGYLVEDTDDYSEYDFYEDVWNKINNMEFFTEDSNFYGGPIAEKKKADIDAFISEYYASMPDVDDCILRLKNGIVDNEI